MPHKNTRHGPHHSHGGVATGGGGGGGSHKARHTTYNDVGQLCITVVDPATRKLLIPVEHIFETRAQHRNTLPSLCQLFLTNRCRQGANCYQVHARWEAVERLRAEVDALPCCCVRHGDVDRAGVCLGPIEFAEYMCVPPLPDYAEVGGTGSSGEDHGYSTFAESSVTSEGGDGPHAAGAADSATRRSLAPRCLADVVLYVPNCTYNDGFIPLEEVSHTVAMKKLMEEQDPLGLAGGPHRDPSAPALHPPAGKRAVVDGTGSTVCRLHALDRCRYAEECKFLHLCKDITNANPNLTLSPQQQQQQQQQNGGGGEDSAAAGKDGRHKKSNGRHPHHGGVSVFTAISRQQQQQQQMMMAGNGSFPPSYPGPAHGPGIGTPLTSTFGGSWSTFTPHNHSSSLGHPPLPMSAGTPYASASAAQPLLQPSYGAGSAGNHSHPAPPRPRPLPRPPRPRATAPPSLCRSASRRTAVTATTMARRWT